MSLSIKNISKTYGEKVIFKDFSYDFDNNGIYLIRGVSGIGKTTLLRIIAGLDSNFDGRVENGGIKNVSFMFQEYRLFPTISALDNVLIVTDKSADKENEAKSMLSVLGITGDDLKKKPSELSGGMKQRIAFVRAVMKHSNILILDEPTKELDKYSVDRMLEIISKESTKRLVLMVTHENLITPENTTVINL